MVKLSWIQALNLILWKFLSLPLNSINSYNFYKFQLAALVMISKKSMLYDYMNILIIIFTSEWSKFGQNSNYIIKAIYTNLAYTNLVETIQLTLYILSLNILQRISILLIISVNACFNIECVPLTIYYQLYFLRASKIRIMLHHGPVGWVQSKEC